MTGVLSPAEIEKAFDLDDQLRNVDTIFARVFDERSATLARPAAGAAARETGTGDAVITGGQSRRAGEGTL